MLLASCASTSNYATSSTSGVPVAQASWQVDSVASRCVASVIGGALVGGVIGALAGGGNGRSVGVGAIAGAATGGVLCAVVAALDEQDKARIRAAQLAAAESGDAQYVNYQGKDGLQRQIKVQVVGGPPKQAVPPRTAQAKKRTTPSPAASPDSKTEAQIAAASGARICRPLNTSIEVQGKGQTDLPQQVVCRTPDGDWVPAAGDNIAEQAASPPKV